MERLSARILLAAAALIAASLLIPWFYGTDDGQPLTIAGWDTEPGFTLGMIGCACVLAVTGAAKRTLPAIPPGVAALALTLWMLPRGERYSGYDLGPGGFIAIVGAIMALAVVAARLGTSGRQARSGRSRAAAADRRRPGS